MPTAILSLHPLRAARSTLGFLFLSPLLWAAGEAVSVLLLPSSPAMAAWQPCVAQGREGGRWWAHVRKISAASSSEGASSSAARHQFGTGGGAKGFSAFNLF